MNSVSLEADGLVVLPRALSQEACDALDAHLMRHPLEDRAEWGVRFAKGFTAHCPDVVEIINSPPNTDSFLGQRILNDEVVETLDTYPGPYPVHQDAAYFPKASISWNVALSDLGDERGGLSVALGSHQNGLLPHAKGELGLNVTGSPPPLQPLRLKRGDVVLIHPHLVHTLVGNRTTLLARLFSVTFG